MPEMPRKVGPVRLELPQELLRRIESEYREMPGLRLSLPQARRLFALRDDICVRVLTTLADRGVLRRDANGAYVLNGDRP